MKPDSATALTFPERIGRYHLLDLLGEGGFARVFRAELQGPSGFRKQVALKLIKDVRPAEVQHLLHEGRVGGLLKHRNVVDTYELGVDGETVYLAMELVEGLSLREMCVRGGVPPSVVMEVIHGICRGVAYAHTLNETEGVVHLDLKPENVLIGWDGSVKVSDFGLAQWVGVQQKVLSSSRGSLGYMSPEQRDGGSITVCSDVFSLGLVIYELVSGASFWPLEESETQELASVEALLGDGSRMAAMDAFAEGLGDLVRRCLEVNSQDRPISAQELVKPVRRLRRQVDDDPPLEEWLAASMNQREVEDLRKRTPSSGSIYGKTFDFAQQEEGLEARLERVLQAFGQCTDQDTAFAALMQLESALEGASIAEQGQWHSQGKRVLAGGGFEWAKRGAIPFAVASADLSEFWVKGEPVARFRRGSLGGRLLHAIIAHGAQWDRERLFVEVWEQAYRPPSSDTALRVQIHRVREKLKGTGLQIEVSGDGRYTVHGSPALLIWHGKAIAVSEEVASSPPTPAQPESNLGPEPNGFVGREEEQGALQQLWETGHRVIVVHGPPGAGKSRLVTHAARRAHTEGRFVSVWACDLEEVDTEEAAITAIGAALGLTVSESPHGQGNAVERIGNALADRGPVLLILDNPERVVSHISGALIHWWSAAPQAHVVVVSQRAIAMEQSVRLAVGPLPTPAAAMGLEEVRQSPGVALFVQRAAAVLNSFALTEDNVGAVCGIVRAVDGLPLAVELAASRVAMMSPQTIQQRLSDRFRLLGGRGGPRDNPALRASLDWSWGLLTETERRALAQLSVFHGSCSWEAAETVIALEESEWVIDVLGRLVEYSLVQVTELEGQSRLGMLALVSDYAGEQLQDMGELGTETLQRHLHYYAGLGREEEEWARRIMGRGDARHSVESELENLVVAVETGLRTQRGTESVLACLAALEGIGRRGPLQRGIRLAQRVLDQANEETPDRQRLALVLAEFQLRVGRVEQGQAGLEALLEGTTQTSVRARCRLASVWMVRGNASGALGHLDDAERIAQGTDSNRLKGLVQLRRGNWCRLQGQVDEALRRLNEAALLAEAIGDRELSIDTYLLLGIAHRSQGHTDRAVQRYEEALGWARDLGRTQSEASLLTNLGTARRQLGALDVALSHYESALRIYRALGNRENQLNVLLNMGVTLEGLDRLDEAQILYEQALALAHSRQDTRVQGVLFANLAVLQARSGDLERARDLFGDALSAHRLVGNRGEEGVVLGNLGQLHREMGDLETARLRLLEALQIARDLRDEGRQKRLQQALDNLDG